MTEKQDRRGYVWGAQSRQKYVHEIRHRLYCTVQCTVHIRPRNDVGDGHILTHTTTTASIDRSRIRMHRHPRQHKNREYAHCIGHAREHFSSSAPPFQVVKHAQSGSSQPKYCFGWHRTKVLLVAHTIAIHMFWTAVRVFSRKFFVKFVCDSPGQREQFLGQ